MLKLDDVAVKAGTELHVGFADWSEKCCLPGSHAAYDELGFTILTFVRAETD